MGYLLKCFKLNYWNLESLQPFLINLLREGGVENNFKKSSDLLSVVVIEENILN